MDLSSMNGLASSSSTIGDNCAEVRLTWRKSSYSGSNGGGCVEVARDLPEAVAVRDSKDPQGPVLTFGPAAWQSFLTQLKSGSLPLG